MRLSNAELKRYSRHFSVPGIGLAGQKTLSQASVCLIGAGGIGSPAALYLAAAGVGTLSIVDNDTVDVSNLQRQILFTTEDIEQSKAECAKTHLHKLNPHIRLQTYPTRLTADNAFKILEPYDLIIDGSDNYTTRYLVNDVCVALEKPFISASVFQFVGQLSVYNYKGGACYRCAFPEPPPQGVIPNCADAGVLGVIPGIMATLAVSEAIKVLLSIGEVARNQFIQFDALTNQFLKLPIQPKENCLSCAKRLGFDKLPRYENSAMQTTIPAISVETLLKWQQANKPFELIDIRHDWEREICKIPEAKHIHMQELLANPQQLDRQKTYVIQCKSGGRSRTVTEHLHTLGYENVYNLEGGILDWIAKVDSSQESY